VGEEKMRKEETNMAIRLLTLARQLTNICPDTGRSFLLSGRQIRLGNRLVTNESPLAIDGELLLTLGPLANAESVRLVLRAAAQSPDPHYESHTAVSSVRRDFKRVLLVGPANDKNLPKIPPKGVYRIAYYLLTTRDDTDVVVYDPNYWFKKFPPLLERRYDVVGFSSLFSSFVHDAELMAVFQERYPLLREALHVLGGMTVSDWPPEVLFSTPIELAVNGLGGERVMSEILDHLPQFQATRNLAVFASLPGVIVRGKPETYGAKPIFYQQVDFKRVVPADFRLVPYAAELDIIGHHGYFRERETPFQPLNEVGLFPLHLLSFQMICQGKCVFCASQSRHILAIIKQGRQPFVRLAPEDLIVLVKEALRQNPRIDNLRFDEDNFLFDAKAARRFAELMISHRLRHIPWKIKTRSDHVARDPELMRFLRSAGCYGVDLGFENGSQRILDLMQKGITVEQNRQTVETLVAAGYQVIQLNYILFNPDSTLADVVQTMREAIDYGERPGVFINLLPYMIALPGAPLMSMPQYQPLIILKRKTLPGGTEIQKPSRLLIRDQETESVLNETLGLVDGEIKAYEQGLRDSGQTFSTTPEYIYPFIFMRTVFTVLRNRSGENSYQPEIERINQLIEKLTRQTEEANHHD
jgi:radical SAM superfamily enzyme YgiQ (UPF0313 family)